MTGQPIIRVLLVESDNNDSMVILQTLARAQLSIESHRVDDEQGMRRAIREREWDIILSSYSLPTFDALAALQVRAELCPDVPFIVVSGTNGEDVAVEMLRLGADDYLLKQNLQRLAPAVQLALASRKDRRHQRSLEHMKSLILANSLDLICSLDSQFVFLEAGDTAIVTLGYAPQELIGRAIAEFLDPENSEVVLSAFEGVKGGVPLRELGIRFLHKSGRIIHTTLSAVWAAPEEVIVCVIRDVTERNTQQERLRLRERALEEVSQGVVICDEHRNVTYANPGFFKMTGFSEEEMLGKNCRMLQGPGTDPETVRAIRMAVTNLQPYDGEILNYRKDGTPFWNELSIAAVRDDAGGEIRYVGIQRDVTESKRSRESLMLALERLQMATKAAHAGTWEHNLLTGSLEWDASMMELHGLDQPPGPVSMAAWFGSIHPDDRSRMKRLREELDEENKSSFDCEFRIIRASDQSIRVVQSKGVLIRDSAGKSVRMLGINWDVTDERNREDQLRIALEHEKELAEKARAGERAKSEFLAVMSHEVRTPLNGILGFAGLLAQSTNLPADQLGYCQTILQSGEALLRILDDILDFSRIDAGRLPIEDVAYDPRGVLEDLRLLMAEQAREQNLDLTIDVGESVPDTLLGDAGRLRQILLNLVGNAIKFTSNGSVSLKLALAGEDDQNEICFTVRDTGCGISPDHLKRIFSPFTQADSSISRRFGGTGLGLAISQRLTELLGGRLTVTSALGGGSEFKLTLPLRIGSSDGVTNCHESISTSLIVDESFAQKTPLKMLVVEDDRVNLKLICALVRRLGYDPIVATNGTEAVEQFRQHSPNLILMDLQMPEMDGIEATKVIRSLEKDAGRRPCHIAALTANIFPADRDLCMYAGMDSYLNKPVKLSLLSELFKRVAAANLSA